MLHHEDVATHVFDAVWGMFRTMLQHESDHTGVWFDEVDERNSTQTCSCCNRHTGPKGRESLGTREWACPGCGADRHRGINAAVDILAAGRRRRAEGVPTLSRRLRVGKDVKRSSGD
jgi:transposase